MARKPATNGDGTRAAAGPATDSQENFRVLDVDGRFICDVDETTARLLLGSGDAELVRSRGGERELKALPRRRGCWEGSGDEWWRPRRVPSPFHQFAAKERKIILRRCRKAMGPRHWLLIRMRYERGLTFATIAAVMQVNEAAVVKMHGRTLRWMRGALAKLGIVKLSQIL